MAHRNPADRARSIEWARELMARPAAWVIIDTETTGLAGEDEVIQIGMLAPDGTVVFDSRIRPARRSAVHPEAQRVHRISFESLRDAPTYGQIAARLDETARGKTLVAYNVGFDSRLLAQSAAANRIPALAAPWECAMLQYARFVGEWNDSRNDYRWPKLPSAAHDAIGDCRATLEVITRMAAG